VICVFWEIQKPCGLKSCICFSQQTFVLQLFKILRSSTRASALKIENFHSIVKILGWPTKWYGTFSSSKLPADSKNVHGLYAWRSTLTTRSKKVKNSWNFKIFSISFLRWPEAVRTDLHRYKICTFLESGCNLQLEKVPYHFLANLYHFVCQSKMLPLLIIFLIFKTDARVEDLKILKSCRTIFSLL
jgi:hypothetical protein